MVGSATVCSGDYYSTVYHYAVYGGIRWQSSVRQMSATDISIAVIVKNRRALSDILKRMIRIGEGSLICKGGSARVARPFQ